jgi:Rieske Fe-S protein
MSEFDRRRFLQVMVASAATSAIAGCAGSNDSSPEAFGDVSAGSLSELQVGMVRAVPGAPVFVGRDSGGIYAMTSTCTHQGCDMASDGTVTTTIVCPCHGSAFDLNGEVVKGPAPSPLTHFAVDISLDGTVTVHGGTTVSSSTRTLVT